MTTNNPETTRRGAIGAMAIAGAMAATGVARTAQAQGAPKTFVLVHGAWHGGWCWRRVADRLERMGHKVYAPTLTGLCDRSHLLTKDIGLDTHATDIANLVKWEGLGDIVLVGHSYGGMLLPMIADKVGPSIASLVLLDAFYPEAGEGLLDLASPRTKEALAAAIAKGDTTIAPIPAAAFNVNEKDRAWVDKQCTPHPARTLVDKISAAAATAREKVGKKAYVRAGAYANVAFDAGLAKAKANAAWKTYTVPCGHDVMVDMPDRLVEILVEVA